MGIIVSIAGIWKLGELVGALITRVQRARRWRGTLRIVVTHAPKSPIAYEGIPKPLTTDGP